MAFSVQQIEAVSFRAAQKTLADNVYLEDPFLTKLREGKVVHDGGHKITLPVIHGAYDDSSGGAYSGAQTLTDSERDDINEATFDFRQRYETVLISQADLLKNRGKAQIINLINSKIKIAQKRMAERLLNSTDGFFSDGTATLGLEGLQRIIDDTVDCGGLAISDIVDAAGNNAWLANVDANSGTARQYTGALAQKAMNGATFGSDRPNYATMERVVFDEVA